MTLERKIEKAMSLCTAPYVMGEGIDCFTVYGFDIKDLEEIKGEIASYLIEIGLDKIGQITLEDFTKDENGNIFNKFSNFFDYNNLQLIVAASHACGFIHRTAEDLKRTMNEISEEDAMIISIAWRSKYLSTDRRIREYKEHILSHTYYSVVPETIYQYATPSRNATLNLSENKN